jgi:polyferredoxin
VAAHRPPGVEAYLPLGSVLAMRRWMQTGCWGEIHPAGLTFLLAVLAGAVLSRRIFCGRVCPVGLLSRVLEWVRMRFLGLPERWGGPRWLRIAASGVKYVLAGRFVWGPATLT